MDFAQWSTEDTELTISVSVFQWSSAQTLDMCSLGSRTHIQDPTGVGTGWNTRATRGTRLLVMTSSSVEPMGSSSEESQSANLLMVKSVFFWLSENKKAKLCGQKFPHSRKRQTQDTSEHNPLQGSASYSPEGKLELGNCGMHHLLAVSFMV